MCNDYAMKKSILCIISKAQFKLNMFNQNNYVIL